jgi:hypothetical protein
MHASPIQAGQAFSGSRLYCTTQMQYLRVEREPGACVWIEMDQSRLNTLGFL